jgi:hypothetical protein
MALGCCRDTPDTIISSSSPECGFLDEDCDFSTLRPIDPASPTSGLDDRVSPTVPLLHPVPTYPAGRFGKTGLTQDVKLKDGVAVTSATTSGVAVSSATVCASQVWELFFFFLEL